MRNLETTLLCIRDVRKSYVTRVGFRRRLRVKAVEGVSLDVTQGRVHAIVGESGSGKSTLARMIVGLEEPDHGEIRYETVNLSEARRNRAGRKRFSREVQMVFQNPYSSLNPRKSIRSILSKPFKVHGEHYTEEGLHRLLSKVELSPAAPFLDKFPHELSGGQRQRVAIARALALGPKLVVLDEPTSALDVTTKVQILDLLKRLQRDEHLTLIFITHELPFLKKIGDHLSVMYNGKVVEKGKSGDIFDNAYHPYTIGLLNSILDIDPQRAREKGIFSVEGEAPSSVTPPSGCRFHPRCPLVEDSCRVEEPPMIAISEDHQVACPVSPRKFRDTRLDRKIIYE
jgi:oligopeptide/dipeptide ABC transporter ATP-binding protein